ncbi:hypothetical protein DPSP01_005474 [Paraphaeosphaeria sporulosa]|uniref:BHLH domain-containing protein n=1 Tax=Paraphaeosphaeria sporulosa TaxID=1460663 RepID=A0A177CD83_9PLEO|nr:uncharacterized protein CC84DRAFT_833967 [Paraphaeosphaeria sporulosa]OAG05266.1 hypothetical protein CC84DRAFT_833967 [Paraphaeosphaeria sporulosa]
MDYIDYSSFPMLASTDCSPTTENFSYPTAFDKAFVGDPFTGNDAPLTAFDYFGRPVSSATATESLNATSSVAPTGPQLESPLAHHPFGQLDVFSSGFPWDTNPLPPTALDLNLSPLSDDSRTPSLCGDAPQPSVLASPPPSPQPQSHSRRQSTSSSLLKFEDPSAAPPKRRRGRPRLDRSSSSLSSTNSKNPRAQRLPHNQVERKYREGLNATLERLRQTVPALCVEDKFGLGGVVGHPKPSKAMILEGAIEYIREIERERDAFRGEVERLRRASGAWDSAAQ